MKISIIIPVYNGEKTINRCINSVRKQLFKDIEIIVVNDGSTDKTKDIIEKLSKIDDRIEVVNQVNSGVEVSRANGIKKSSGDFLMFLDADDTLPKTACKDLVSVQKETNADVVFGKFQRVFKFFTKKINDADIYNNCVITKHEFMEKYYISFFGVNILPVNVCGKLYRKELFNDILIFGLNHAEDLCLNMHILPKAELICSTDKVVYSYFYGGMTTKYNEELLSDAVKAYEIKRQYLTKYNYYRGFVYTNIELVNFLITDIKQLYLYKSFSEKELLHSLKEKASSESFIKCLEELKITKYYEQPKFSLIIDGILDKNENDLIKWVNLALGNKNKLKNKFVFKNILCKFLLK